MKNYLALLTFALVLSAGCTKEEIASIDEECGLGGATTIYINDASDWNSYPKVQTHESYKVVYDTLGNKAYFTLHIECREICTKENPIVKSKLSLAIEDPAVELHVTADEANNHQRSIVTRTGTEYNVEDTYMIKNTQSPTTTVAYNATCKFPSKGSWPADSTYFFLNLIKFEHTTAFKQTIK